jgi:nucleoside-diphosphate-sugar epimerase
VASYFVTGASGFVGSHLVRVLLGRDHRVWCLSRSPPARFQNHTNLKWIKAGIGESAVYRDVLARVDYVLHLASLLAARRRSDYERTNVVGTEELLRACKAVGAAHRRIVYMSSIAAMGPRYDGGLLRESARCSPESEYGASKLAAERLVLEHAESLPVVVLRPSFVYGEGDTRAATYLRAFLEPSPRPWRSIIRTISLCHVADVVESCLLAADRDTADGEVFIISEPETYTWDSLQTIVTGAFGRLLASGEVQVRGDGAALLARVRQLKILAGGEPRYQYWGCDTGKARAGLGFQAARSARESATDTIRSYMAAGVLSPFFEIRQEIDGATHTRQ